MARSVTQIIELCIFHCTLNKEVQNVLVGSKSKNFTIFCNYFKKNTDVNKIYEDIEKIHDVVYPCFSLHDVNNTLL